MVSWLKSKGKILFLGIGGSGVSSLAHMALDCGFSVFGYDQKKSHVTSVLSERGATIQTNLEGWETKDFSAIVYSTAVTSRFVSFLEKARSESIPVLHRSEFMHLLVSQSDTSVSIAGSHGKTSTTAMVSQILWDLNLDPTVMVGGDVPFLQGKGGRFGSGKLSVYESDESDGTFLGHIASIRVLTNVDDDHLDHYKTRENLLDSFSKYLSFSSEGKIVLLFDDPGIEIILTKLALSLPQKIAVTLWICYAQSELTEKRIKALFGEREGFRLLPFTFKEDFLEFQDPDRFELYRLKAPFPGKHYLTNGLLAAVACYCIGVPWEKSLDTLEKYKGVKRRMELLGSYQNVPVYDDYGHHPTEIRTVIESLLRTKKVNGRLIVIFQPHRYSRTALLLKELAISLRSADLILLLPIYSAGEENTYGISSEDMLVHIEPKDVRILNNDPIQDKETIRLLLKENDILLCLGAGNVRLWGEAVVGSKS